MKKIFNILALCGLVAVTSSCNKYLDVNTNPNSPTTSTPELVLPQAIVATAAVTVTFNTYGAWVGGFQANAGGYGGFGSVLTYNYATTDNNGMWSGSYDNIADYQYILDNTTPTGDYKYYNAAARIMKCFAYQRLVDQYGDVPYTEATKGLQNLTPKYDKAEDIYKDLFTQLNAAITVMSSAPTANTVSIIKSTVGSVDVLFGVQAGATVSQTAALANWVRLANTLKLRMLIRIQNVASLATTFAAEKATLATNLNFLTDDAIVQPGYIGGQSGKQNPAYNAYAYTYTNAAANLTTIPTSFVVGFYNGQKLTDAGRGAAVYRSLTSYTGQLGSNNNPSSTNGSPWYIATSAGTNTYGVIKGPAAGQPIFLAADSYFLQAEARLISLIPGSVEDAFNAGILASFTYLDKNANGTVDASRNPAAEVATYKTANSTQGTGSLKERSVYLVTPAFWGAPNADDYNTSTVERTREAIITQKYIALNFIHSDEAWNEYRRTGWPRTVPGGVAAQNFASTQSVSTRTDKLPVRNKYPSTEYALNAQNVPADKNVFTDRIFWDVN